LPWGSGFCSLSGAFSYESGTFRQAPKQIVGRQIHDSACAPPPHSERAGRVRQKKKQKPPVGWRIFRLRQNKLRRRRIRLRRRRTPLPASKRRGKETPPMPDRARDNSGREPQVPPAPRQPANHPPHPAVRCRLSPAAPAQPQKPRPSRPRSKFCVAPVPPWCGRPRFIRSLTSVSPSVPLNLLPRNRPRNLKNRPTANANRAS